MKPGAVLALFLLLAPVVVAGTGPEVRLVCPGPGALPPGPQGLPPPTPATTMLRDDPDGLRTLVLAIDDPFVAPYEYVTTPRGDVVYTHRWGGDLVTLGLVIGDVRVPLAILEGQGIQDALLADAFDLAVLALDGASVLLHDAGMDLQSPDAFESAPAELVWTSFRRIEGQEAWTGFARTRQATATVGDNGRATCLRIELVTAARTAEATTSLAGGYVQASKVHRTELGVVSETFGVLAGATAAGVDTPMAGTRMGQTLTTDSATNEVSLGATDERGRYRPLLGVRQASAYAEAPERYNSMLSIGTYAPDRSYVPLAGVRSHFERALPLDWIASLLQTGGPGSSAAGDWEQDVGAFDPFGRFVPAFGVAYDDTLGEAGRATQTGIEARHAHQALLSVGIWVLEAYQPLAGATYDGEEPLLHWQDMGAGEVPGDWLASGGAFAPLVGYAPVLGIEYAARPGLEEEVRVGTFAGSYASFLPVAGARWTSDRPSALWAASFFGRAPSAATLEAGPVVDGELRPTARAVIEAGDVDRYHVHVAALDPAPPVASLCRSDAQVGLAVGGMPILVIDRLDAFPASGRPEARPGADCR